MNYILDSWAILAWLQNERPAADVVDDVLSNTKPGDIAMSRINAGEAFYVTAKTHSLDDARRVRSVLEKMPVELLSVTDDLVWGAARLKAHHALSYADAVAAALSLERDAVLLTGDREFTALVDAEGLVVEWLHRDE